MGLYVDKVAGASTITTGLANSFDVLGKQFVSSYSAALNYVDAIKQLQAASGGGKDVLGLYPGILSGIEKSYGLVGVAARQAAATIADSSKTAEERLTALQSLMSQIQQRGTVASAPTGAAPTTFADPSEISAANKAIQDYAASISALTAKYDPLVAATQQYQTALAGIQEAQDKGAISAATAGQAQKNAMIPFIQAQAQAAIGTDQLRASFDKVYASSQAYAVQLKYVELAGKALGQTEGQIAAIQSQVTASFASANQPMQQLNANLGVHEGSTRASSFAARQLVVQLNQTWSSIATGQPFLTVLLQQGHQIFDVMVSQRVGVADLMKTLSGYATAIGAWMITPTGLAITAVAALVTALGVLALSINSTQNEMQKLQNELSATQTGYMGLSKQVSDVATTLTRTTDLTRAQAIAATQAFAALPQNVGKTNEQFLAMVKTANDFAKVMGTDVTAAVKKVTDGLGDPVKIATEFAKQGMTAFSASVVASIAESQRLGDTLAAQNKFMDAVGVQASAAKDKLTPLQSAMKDLGTEFHFITDAIKEFLKSMGDLATSAVVGVINGLVAAMREAKALKDSLATPGPVPPSARLGSGLQYGTSQSVFGTGQGRTDVTLGPFIPSLGNAQAVGAMQVLPTTRDIYAPSADLNTLSGNIEAGLRILKAYTDQSGLSGGLGRYGGASTAEGQASYVKSVLSQGPLPPNSDVGAMIDWWAPKIGMSPELVAIGKLLAKKESGGQQFGGTAQSTIAQMSVAGFQAPATRTAFSDQQDAQLAAERQQQALAGQADINSMKLQNDEITRLGLAWRDLMVERNRAIAQNDVPEIERTTAALAKNEAELRNTIDPTLKGTEALQNQLQVTKAVTDAERIRAQVKAESDARVQSGEKPFTQAETDARVAAMAADQAAKNTAALHLQADATLQVNDQIRQTIELRDKALASGDTAEVIKQNQALKEQEVARRNIIDPTLKGTDALRDQVKVTEALGSADKARAAAQAEIDAQARTGRPFTDEQAAARLAALTDTQTAAFTHQVAVMDQAKSQQDKVADAALNGAQAQAIAAAKAKAYADAQEFAGTADARNIPIRDLLTQKYLDAAAAQEKIAINQKRSEIADQSKIIDAETASLGMNAEARDAYIGHLQRELDIRKNMPNSVDAATNALTKEAAALLSDEDALARNEEALKRQQGALDELAGAFTSAFDTISSAMAQAFVQGQGAAVNWGNVMKAVVQQVISEFLKLAILNPLLNGLFGKGLTALGDVFGLGGGGGGGAGGILGGGLLAAGALGGGGNDSWDLSTGSIGQSVSGGAGGVLGGGGIGGGWLMNALGLANTGSNLFGFGGIGDLFKGTGFFGSQGTVANLLATQLISPPGLAGTGVGSASGLGADAGSFGALDLSGGATIGQVLGGLGAGFGAGSLAGGFVQNALGKTGPGPTIGAGAGAAIGTAAAALAPETLGISLLLGGLFGGLAGGLGGGLIGPKPASAYSLTNFGLDQSGMFTVGSSANQSSKGQFSPSNLAQVTAEVKGLNDTLMNLGVSVNTVSGAFANGGAFTAGRGTALIGAVGQGSPKGGDDVVSKSLTDLFSNMRFTANDPLVKQFIENKSFANLDALSAAVQHVETFVNQTVPALQNWGRVNGTLVDSLVAINAAFDPAIATAKELGYAEDNLTTIRDAAIAKANKAATEQFTQTAAGIAIAGGTANNQLMVQGSVGQLTDALQTALFQFDKVTVPAAEKQLHDSLTAIFGDTFDQSAAYAGIAAQQEQTLGQQRLVIQKAANDQIVAAERALAAQLVSINTDLASARVAADLALTGNTASEAGKQAALNQFDQVTVPQMRAQLDAKLLPAFQQGSITLEDYVHDIAYQEQTLAEQRVAIIRSADEQIAASAQQAAAAQIAAQQAIEAAVKQGTSIVTQLYADRTSLLSATAPSDAAGLAFQRDLALQQFDQFTRPQKWQDFVQSLQDTYHTVIDQNGQFGDLLSFEDENLSMTRLGIAKQFNTQIAALDKQAADQRAQQADSLVNTLSSYAQKIQFGSQSPLSANDQYALAQKQYNAVAGAALAGNASSIAQLPQYSDALLAASRAVNGAGAQYAADFQKVLDTINNALPASADQLTALVFQTETRTQTQVLSSDLGDVKDLLQSLLSALNQNSTRPVRAA